MKTLHASTAVACLEVMVQKLAGGEKTRSFQITPPELLSRASRLFTCSYWTWWPLCNDFVTKIKLRVTKRWPAVVREEIRERYVRLVIEMRNCECANMILSTNGLSV